MAFRLPRNSLFAILLRSRWWLSVLLALGVFRAAGRRYLESPDNGWRFFLFVRERKDAAYCAIGAGNRVSIEGDRPMSVQWRLEVPLPMELFRSFSVLRA